MKSDYGRCAHQIRCPTRGTTTAALDRWLGIFVFPGLILAFGCQPSADADASGSGGVGGASIVDEEKDDCSGRSKVDLGAPVIESYCEYVVDLGNGDSGYRCSCDVDWCAGGDRSGGGKAGAPSVSEEELCNLEIVSSMDQPRSCDAALQDACGVQGGNNGFCTVEHESFSPTHEGQESPPPKTVECVEQADGTHACSCGAGAEPVDSSEGECLLAAYSACQTTCESDLGTCTPNGYGYDCSCNAGFDWTAEMSASCEHTLHRACAPSCEKSYDACYANDTGELYYCTCGVSPEVHEVMGDPNGSGDECLTPLLEVCGSGGED